MSIPITLDNALKAAERLLPDDENRCYRDALSFYSTMLLGNMIAQSETSSKDEEDDLYSFKKVIDFVHHHFPLSEDVRSMPVSGILKEIKDVAWEIEGCVIETITYLVNDLDGNPYTMRHYDDLPSAVRFKAWKYLVDQLFDLGVPMDNSIVRPFVKGLLAHRWNLFATTLDDSSPSPDASIF